MYSIKQVKTFHWRSTQSYEYLEARIYKSGQIRFYQNSEHNKTFTRVTEDTALWWIKKKYFVMYDEYLKIKYDEIQSTILRGRLIRAQKIGKKLNETV